ncbi:MAG: response regulator, partial [Planctomycetota bacterium]|nr:response regulator [Planctomycetota bacterium]
MAVLLVDDDPTVRLAVGRLVERMGYTVTRASDGEEAWDIVQQQHFPILITDWFMPGMDGIDLVKHLRQQESEHHAGAYTYIIALTGEDDPKLIKQGMDAGVDDFLFKHRARQDLDMRLSAARRIMSMHTDLQNSHARMREDLEAAERVQRSLLPESPPGIPNLLAGWRMDASAHLAGDLFNLFSIDEEHLGFYVLDVSGHGVAAALLATQLSRLMIPDMSQSQVVKEPREDAPWFRVVEPGEVFDRLNKSFPMSSRQMQFITMFYGVINHRSLVLRYAGAGHPRPIAIGDETRTLPFDDPPLGVKHGHSFTTHEVQMLPDERLFV